MTNSAEMSVTSEAGSVSFRDGFVGVALHAIDHRAEPVRPLRGEVLRKAERAEGSLRVGFDDLEGTSPSLARPPDQPAGDRGPRLRGRRYGLLFSDNDLSNQRTR